MGQRPLRHAYLIITHGNFPILEKQLRFLDSENADFYIHVDARARGFDPERYRAIPAKSRVVFAKRTAVAWGGYSMIRCEVELLNLAAAEGYDYYHLLSGVDVPVKPRAYIEAFFQNAGDMNFINFQAPVISQSCLDRVRFYYPFQAWNIRNRPLRLLLRKLSSESQRLLGVDRTRACGPEYVFQKGTNWFSITHPLALYVIEWARTPEARRVYRSTCCADEVFLQTIVVNSPFRDTLPPHAFDGRHRNCCRYIDWTRGRPYVFTDGDWEELTHTDPWCLFARKFDYRAWPGVVDRLFAYFGEGGPGAGLLPPAGVPGSGAETPGQ